MRPERMVPENEAKEILARGEWGVLSTATLDGEPYGVPVNYYYAPEEQAIYIHCALRGRKLTNIAQNSRVSFAVVAEARIVPERYTTHYDSAIASGRAQVVTDAAEKRRVLFELCRVLTPDAIERRDAVIEKYLPAVAIIKITVERITGKRNRDL